MQLVNYTSISSLRVYIINSNTVTKEAQKDYSNMITLDRKE